MPGVNLGKNQTAGYFCRILAITPQALLALAIGWQQSFITISLVSLKLVPSIWFFALDASESLAGLFAGSELLKKRLPRGYLGHVITQLIVLVIIKFKCLNDIQAKFFSMGFIGSGINLVDKSN